MIMVRILFLWNNYWSMLKKNNLIRRSFPFMLCQKKTIQEKKLLRKNGPSNYWFLVLRIKGGYKEKCTFYIINGPIFSRAIKRTIQDNFLLTQNLKGWFFVNTFKTIFFLVLSLNLFLNLWMILCQKNK